MWIDAENIDIDGKLEMIFDDKRRVARWDIKRIIVLKLQEHRVCGGGFIRKIEANTGLHSLGFPGRLQMHV